MSEYQGEKEQKLTKCSAQVEMLTQRIDPSRLNSSRICVNSTDLESPRSARSGEPLREKIGPANPEINVRGCRESTDEVTHLRLCKAIE